MLYDTPEHAASILFETWRWPHFTIPELSCRCAGRFCEGEYWHDPEFLDALEGLRRDVGRPLFVTSAHRCAQWNAAVGGAPMSRHKQIAVDISLLGHDGDALYRASERRGFTGIGLARSFIHLDRRRVSARWTYRRRKTHE